MICVDLNCDLGEGGDHDRTLLGWVTSANVACGGHAGDRATMLRTVSWARERQVAIGAHPGYADRDNFGRREMSLTPQAIQTLVEEQVSRLRELTELHHVKPHGALYNQAARDPAVAAAIVAGVKACDPDLMLYGLAGSVLIDEGLRAGLRVVREGFADRSYEITGGLTPRDRADAVHTDVAVAARQAVLMVVEGTVICRGGERISLRADTLCIHGDGAHAVSFAQTVHTRLSEAGVTLKAPV